jgi:hypothetical protein
MNTVRKAAFAGAFYPADKEMLKNMINDFMNSATEPSDIKDEVKAVIVPHAGYVYSGVVAAAGYKLFKKANRRSAGDLKVLLIGPSHRVRFNGAASTVADSWQTPIGKVNVKNILDEIGKSEIINPSDEVMAEEHSLEVQVPFLQTVLDDFTLYPLCLGELNTEFLAKELKSFVERDDVIVVVSSDLSHYYTYDEAVALDDYANKYIPRLAVNEVRDRVEACGINGILTLLKIAEMLDLKGHFVDYKNSGDTAGDKSQVVGYGCYAFTK